MKKVFLFILTTLLIINVKAQERVNREKLVFQSSSGLLSKAIGWAYNKELGEWIDFENLISIYKEDKQYTDVYDYLMSKQYQSFISLQTKTINFKGETLYVIVVEKISGKYEYPSIKEDWYTYQETMGFIFSKSEYQKLLNIENLIELKTKYKVSIGSKYEKYDETKFLDYIQTELVSQKTEYSNEYVFSIKKSKEGAIRFYIPIDTYSYKYYDYEKKYFETDYTNFSNIIIKS